MQSDRPPILVGPLLGDHGTEAVYAYLLDYRLEIGDQLAKLLFSGNWRRNAMVAYRLFHLLVREQENRLLLARVGYRTSKPKGIPKTATVLRELSKWQNDNKFQPTLPPSTTPPTS